MAAEVKSTGFLDVPPRRDWLRFLDGTGTHGIELADPIH